MHLLNLVLVLGLALVAFAAKFALTGASGGGGPAAVSQPKRQLDDVRRRAADLGTELQQRADRANADR